MNTNKMSFLERAVQTYYLDPGVALWRAIEADLFSNYSLKKPILDLGCGNGDFLKILFNSDNNVAFNESGPVHRGRQLVVGIDLNKKEIYRARQNGLYDYLIVGEARRIPFKDGIFSTVISNCVLEHIPDVEQVLASVATALADGGKIYFTVPSEFLNDYLIMANLFKKMRLRALEQICKKRRNRKLQHINMYNLDKWSRVLEKAGLDVVTHHYYLPKRTVIIWDLLFSFARLGIWKFDVGNFLYYVLDRCLQLLRIRVQPILSRVFYKTLRKHYQTGGDEEGGGLFIVARKRSLAR